MNYWDSATCSKYNTIRMISTSTLFFVLALSCSTFAFTVTPGLLLDGIASKVAHDMAVVAKASAGLSEVELNNRLLDTMTSSLNRLKPELQEIYLIKGASFEIAKKLSLKINHNRELNDALASRVKTAPRFIGALALGITQVATDVVKMALTRY